LDKGVHTRFLAEVERFAVWVVKVDGLSAKSSLEAVEALGVKAHSWGRSFFHVVS
jgi:hypothetical protein